MRVFALLLIIAVVVVVGGYLAAFVHGLTVPSIEEQFGIPEWSGSWCAGPNGEMTPTTIEIGC